MSVIRDTEETVDRGKGYISEFQKLFKARGLGFGRPRDIWIFISEIAANSTFGNEFRKLCLSILEREKGKLTLGALFTIVGASIGGLGIAGMGGAIGIPAAALTFFLGTLGLGLGQELDSISTTGSPDQESAHKRTLHSEREELSGTRLESGLRGEISQNLDGAYQQYPTLGLIDTLQSFDQAFSRIETKAELNRDGINRLASEIVSLQSEVQQSQLKQDSEFANINSLVSSLRGELAENHISHMKEITRSRTINFYFFCAVLALIGICSIAFAFATWKHALP